MKRPSPKRLSRSMGLTQFDNGYWYAAELKQFAKETGIAHAGTLRKVELEHAIKLFLKTGRIRITRLKKPRVKDVERGLSLDSARPLHQLRCRFFRSGENAARQQVMKAWAELKKMDVPKTYRSWVASKRKRT